MKSIMQQTAEHIELERREVEERNMADERCGLVEGICPVCKKSFLPAPYHVYKDDEGRKVCSYHCRLKSAPKKNKRLAKWGL